MNILSGLHKHHLVPKYMGGDNSPSNIVLLEPIDHAIIHFVRYKIYKHPADAWAHNRLVSSFNEDGIPTIVGFDRPYLRGVPKTEEHKKKISKSNKGKKRSIDMIEQMRIRATGKSPTDLQLKALMSGRSLSNTQEAREKKSNSLKGRDVSAWIHKVHSSLKGRAISDESKALLLSYVKGKKQTPEQIAKRVASRKATLEEQGRTR